MQMGFRFASAVSTQSDLPYAVDEAVAQVQEMLGGRRPDLALAFLSGDFAFETRQAAKGLLAGLDPQVLVGCTAEGVIARDREIEGQTALTVAAATLPGVKVSPLYSAGPHLAGPAAGWRRG